MCTMEEWLYIQRVIFYSMSVILCASPNIQISSLHSLCLTCMEVGFKPKIYKIFIFKLWYCWGSDLTGGGINKPFMFAATFSIKFTFWLRLFIYIYIWIILFLSLSFEGGGWYKWTFYVGHWTTFSIKLSFNFVNDLIDIYIQIMILLSL